MSSNQDQYIVVFDGVCHLCNGLVNFLLKRDKRDRLRFALLQHISHLDQDENIKQNILSTDSIALITGGKVYLRSAAVLKILKRLGGGWQLFYVFIIIPRPVRDWVYEIVARNRYQWFGKKDTCMVPDEKMKKKFIEE